ncbi:ADP compounds hydrolase NudE [Legionella hackeliae]|uniref:ADP-ribose diphosphatase n=1 Tax=Legionella hackeliae TaxID=449 RepID=A0A0A8ULD0_LEGHA|nr:ADP compounds hydrolase NudE [Legionella hackeliae]KTD10151.1 NUDIX hydrolase [Legionella hackeliae]CEK09645.1 ADP-ribose diphosphatase [Legionella hackeliae]STX49556.1 NUDIX hydrolase [Legionella hackeliae]
MREKPVCSKRSVVAKSNLFTIEQMHLHFSNGAKRIYERIRSHGHGAVLIAAVTASESFLLVREYAAGTDAYELAFPKGITNQGETALEAANRELREETGFAARQLKELKRMTLAPGYFGAALDLVVAYDLYSSPLEGDEPEPLEVIEWPLDAIDELLIRPDFSEARSIAALFLVKQWWNKEKNNE